MALFKSKYDPILKTDTDVFGIHKKKHIRGELMCATVHPLTNNWSYRGAKLH